MRAFTLPTSILARCPARRMDATHFDPDGHCLCMREVRVSSQAWFACLDPGASNAARESGWPEPSFRIHGRGRQAVYRLTLVEAAEMAEHLDAVAGSFAYGDAYTRVEGRACARAAASIRRQVGL